MSEFSLRTRGLSAEGCFDVCLAEWSSEAGPSFNDTKATPTPEQEENFSGDSSNKKEEREEEKESEEKEEEKKEEDVCFSDEYAPPENEEEDVHSEQEQTLEIEGVK